MAQFNRRNFPLAEALQKVRLRDAFPLVPGVVRWLEEDRAGIEFDRPLHLGVAAHMPPPCPRHRALAPLCRIGPLRPTAGCNCSRA